MKKTITIYVEGNVGAGKTTLLNFIKNNFDIEVVYEPYELWQNIGGQNLLEQFFKDQARWAFTLQTYVTLTLVEQLNQTLLKNQGKIQIAERSVYSGRYCFGHNTYDMGLLTDLEWYLYQKYWDNQIKDLLVQPTAFIYLRIPAQVCHERIIQRGRFEEKPITLEYLKNLERKHDEWLLYKKTVENLKNIPVLVLDSDRDLRSDKIIQQAYIQKIKEFIDKL